MPKPKVLENQISFDMFGNPSHIHGACPEELRTVDVGGGKSFCRLMDCWTNCLEVGHCVYESR